MHSRQLRRDLQRPVAQLPLPGDSLLGQVLRVARELALRGEGLVSQLPLSGEHLAGELMRRCDSGVTKDWRFHRRVPQYTG